MIRVGLQVLGVVVLVAMLSIVSASMRFLEDETRAWCLERGRAWSCRRVEPTKRHELCRCEP